MKNILGSTKLQLVFLIVISLFVAFILVIGNLWQEIRQRAAPSPRDYTRYVNMVQGPGMPNNSDRQVFMRYPLGRVGLWSRDTGEIADSVTRGVRLYPTVDQVVNKDNTDWRSTIIGNPSETDITYRSDVAAKGSTVALTVTPNVSIYRYHFHNVSSYAAVAIKLQNPYDSSTWTNNTITIVDNQTIQATLGSNFWTIYYYIKFSVPAIGRGTFSGSAITDGSSSNIGANNGGYLKFNPSTPDVTVAVALSHSSMALAQQFFTNEFSDFNFAAASQRLKDAWNAKLGKIEVQNADQITKQMLYTGLYTVYANVINATDGSPYAPYAAAYGSPILTIGSSPGWAHYGGGYLRSQFDMARNVYALLSLIDPSLMTDILHTYQAQYDLNKVMLGNWDPYCTVCWNDIQWGFFGGMFLRAYLQGVTGVDYIKAKNSIADTFGNTNNYMYKSQYLTKGYIPANSGPTSEYMSRGLEFSTQVQGLALLANALGDNATYHQYIGRGQNYKQNWDAANMVFRGKNSDGSWAAMNTGFFEGSDKRYAFDVVHDPLGLADLYGDSTMTSQINTLLAPDKDYNDYEPTYQILPIYSNSPSTAQDITRNRFVPQFKSLNMWEGWWRGSDVYYTDNASALVLAILGLYPIQAPGAQWVITSPSVTTAVIHGMKDTIIQANHNSTRNTYISSIQVNGATYPSYFISGKRLVTENTTITLGMTSTPSRIGNMYVTGTDGEVLAASTDNTTFLQFQNDPIALTSRAKIYATKRPAAVSVNGSPLTNWTYDSSTSTLNIKGIPAGNILISFGGTIYTYQGHTSIVTGVAWSPDGKRIASASQDETVQVWDATTGGHVLRYRGHKSIVTAVAWSPNGKSIASASQDGAVQVWNAITGTYMFTYRGHTDTVTTLAWSTDGTRIASSSSDKTVQVWDAATGKRLLTYQGHSNIVRAVAWSPDGRQIASASDDHTVQVWDAATGNNVYTYHGHAGPVNAVAWSPDSKRIASGSDDHTVQIWNATTGGGVFIYYGHGDAVKVVAWSPDGRYIASTSLDGKVQVWKAARGKLVFTYQGHTSIVTSLAWSPDSTRIASGSTDLTVRVWQIE